ncbi:MAG TPA: hypothetical protein VLA21_09715, partial [Candidatus Limnocylindria bacterium]|nr:hypothetical protein [Candidatus Limnocylindria bacterium]
MRKTRGPVGYFIMIAAFLLLAFLISDSIGVQANRITYPELLSRVENSQLDRVAIRYPRLIGLNKGSAIARGDFPARFDFETTIGEDFIDTVRTMHATKFGRNVDTVSVNDLDFAIDYLPPIVTPWYMELLPYILTMGLVM